MLLHHKDSTQKEFKLIVKKKERERDVFATGEKTVSESYECVHKFVNLKHAISGKGGVMSERNIKNPPCLCRSRDLLL